MMFSIVLVAVACHKRQAAPPLAAHAVDAAVATAERVPDAATPVPVKPAGAAAAR